MALRYWLPCNGTTKNLGMAGDLKLPSYDFTDGMIGTGIQFTKSAFNKGTCIMYPEYRNEDMTFASLIQIDDSQTSYQIFFLHVEASSDEYYPAIFPCASICDGGLHSIIATFENPDIFKFYIDGELVKTATSPSGYFAGGIYIPTGAIINDFRMYDHILSAKEMDIVSRPLIFRQLLSRGADPLVYNTEEYKSFGLSDLSGFGHDLTTSGIVVWQTNSPLSYGSVAFDGRGYFSTPNIELTTPECNYTFWAKMSNWGNMISGQSYPVLSFTDDLTEIKFIDGSIKATIETADSYCEHSSDVSTLSDGWHFFSVSYGDGSVEIRIDGNEITGTQFDETSNVETSSGDMVIGKDLEGNLANGLSLYDLRVYARRLSTDDLTDLYTAKIGVDNKGNLYAHNIEPNTDQIAFGANGVVKADIIESENGFRAYKDHIECTNFQEI